MAVGSRKFRTGVSATAAAAAAMVALTASQAPGVQAVLPPPRAGAAPTGDAATADGNSPYHTELPPLESPEIPDKPNRPGDNSGTERASKSEAGIPATVLAAYKNAEKRLAGERPGCHLPWELLAAIGRVESGQARGGALDKDGNTLRAIRGPLLDGNGFALIRDTDGGSLDGDRRFDRAVGPMQFIPSTWARWGADGNADGVRDPNNMYDAALAAGRYLCADGRDLSRAADLERAVLSYNHSRDYLRTVLTWLEFYRKGTHEVPDGTGSLPDTPGAGNPTRPSTPNPAEKPAEPSRPAEPSEPRDPSETEEPTVTPSVTPSPSGSGDPTPAPTDPTPTPTNPTPAPTDPTPTPTGDPTPTPTGEPTPCPTATAEPTPTDSATATQTPAPTPTQTPAPSPTATGPTSPSPTDSPTQEPPTQEPPTQDPDDPEAQDEPCGDDTEEDGGSSEEPEPGPTPSAGPTDDGQGEGGSGGDAPARGDDPPAFQRRD